MDDDQGLWRLLEFAMRDFDISHSLLTSLPVPPTASPPPHIARLRHLRHLLSVADSHLPFNTVETLETVYRLLPPPPTRPSDSLSRAYSSLLFLLSLALSADMASAISRIASYEFAHLILTPWKGMLKERERKGSCAVNWVDFAKNRVADALKEFVKEELTAMQPFFLVRQFTTEQQDQTETEKQKNISTDKSNEGNGTRTDGAGTSFTRINPKNAPNINRNKNRNGGKRQKKFRVRNVNCPPERRTNRMWHMEEELNLIEAVTRFGKGRWKKIKSVYKKEFEGRTNVDLKDKWRNLSN